MGTIRNLTGIIFVAVIGLFFLSRLISLPLGWQVAYNRFIFSLWQTANNEQQLKEVHKATKVYVQRADGSWESTYRYSKKDRAVVARDSARCIACHGYMVEQDKKAENAQYYMHQKMLTATMLDFLCTDCHKEVDIDKRSPDKATIRVDRSLCPICHNPSSKSIPSEQSGGQAFGSLSAPSFPPVMQLHGQNKEEGKKWISMHPKIAMSIGVNQCRECHKFNTELDFCRTCHLRGGMRPSSHRVVFKEAINKIYPDKAKSDVVETKWLGYHFVVAREALAKMGVKVDSPRNLPYDKLVSLGCGACHELKDWCTRCHIKHADNWLNPVEGHPYYVRKYGTKYCTRCHDPLGSKCVSCHTFFGRLD